MTNSSDPAASLSTAFIPSTAEGIFVVLVILALAGYAFFRSRNIMTALRQHEGAIKQFQGDAGNWDERSAPQQLQKQGATGTILGEVWSHLWQVRQLPGVDIQTAFMALPLLEDEALAKLRQRPNQLMLLGLFGTVLGLSLTIGNFAPQLKTALASLATGGSPDSLNDGLGVLLERMKVAFICTLWGVAGSLVVARAVVLPVTQYRDRVQRQLEQFVMFQLTPLAWASSTRREEALLTSFAHNRTALEQIHGTLKDQLGMFESRTTATVEAIRGAGQRLEEAGGRAADAANASAEANRQATLTLQSVSTALNTGEAALTTSIQSLDRNLEALNLQQTAYEATQAHVLETTGAHARDLNGMVETFESGTASLLDGLQNTLDEFESARAELFGQTAQIVDRQQQLGEMLDQSLKALYADVGQAIQGHTTSVNTANEELARVAQSLRPLDELAQRLDPQALPTERWASFQQGLDTLAGQWSAVQDTTAQKLTALVDTLDAHSRTSLDDVRQQAHLMQADLSGSVKQVTAALEASMSRWDSVHADLAQRTTGTLHGQMSLAGQIQSDHEHLKRELKRTASALEAVASQIQTFVAAQAEAPRRETTRLLGRSSSLPGSAGTPSSPAGGSGLKNSPVEADQPLPVVVAMSSSNDEQR